MADPVALVRRYYAALDDHEYGALRELLDPSFVQQRPDRRFEGREAFVRFMRDERPMTDTSHEIGEAFADADGERAAARGRLLDADGEPVFEFADQFRIEGDRIVRLDTYSR